MSSEQEKKLVSLLKQLKNEGRRLPNFPLQVFYEISQLTRLTAVEVLITQDGKDFLLTERRDDYWDGWHIPGGFIGYTENAEQACNRIAQKEINVKVRLQNIREIYFWEKHPYGNPISLVCVCTAVSDLEKRTDGTFYTSDTKPKDIIFPHILFIENFIKGESKTVGFN